MYTELTAKKVKTRKKHQCEWCAEIIKPKNLVNYRSFVFDGDFNSSWSHPECWNAMEKQDNDILEEGWMPGAFKRGSIEER